MLRPLSRRTMLKGVGTAVALPWLEAMLPRQALATTSAAAAGPRRVGFIYVPNGINMQHWTPAAVGADYQLTRALEPLAPFKNKMTVLSGLTCDKANPNGDGPGDHARAMSAYLTGCQPRKTEGANIHIGMSVDQAAAARIGHLTRFPSLELGVEQGAQTGRCDSGYSCAYSHNLSWRNESTPVVKDANPQSVFDRLFGNGNTRETAQARARREGERRSVLDFVLEEANTVQGELGTSDRRKVEEYMASIREIENRLSAVNSAPVARPAGVTRPEAMTGRSNYRGVVRLMSDMIALAFQGDLTRVFTLPFADEGSNQTYAWADANVPHHGTSHHGGNAEKLEQLARINRYHVSEVAYLLGKLDAIQEGISTVLDNCMISYGSGNSDGARHNHDNLPLLLLGSGGGSIRAGRHIRYPNFQTPLNNLWLAMLDRVGAPYPRLGDSTGLLESLS